MPDHTRLDRVRRVKCVAACDDCKRRKERCNGVQPCSRCQVRGVSASCLFSVTKPRAKTGADTVRTQRSSADAPPWRTRTLMVEEMQSGQRRRTPRSLRQEQNTPLRESLLRPTLPRTPTYTLPVGVPAVTGKVFSTGLGVLGAGNDTPVLVCYPSGFALLHNVRTIVKNCLGACDFLSDSRGKSRITSQNGQFDLALWQQGGPWAKPSLSEASYYIRRYILATSWWLDINDRELLLLLPQWLDSSLDASDSYDPLYFLIFAIGAQTCPEDRDDLADAYFTLARHLVADLSIDEPTIATVRCHCLISMYLLGDSRANSAYAHLGMAVRAAYVLGLHSEELSAQLSPTEYILRERVWKSLRFLDTFLSASLGRPLSTRETRDTESKAQSPALGICHIYEMIMSDVYAGELEPSQALDQISVKQRQWATRLADTLALDSIQSSTNLTGSEQLNISLLHVKQSFYCSIILLTWPTFYKRVGKTIGRIGQGMDEVAIAEVTCDFSTRACIDSAIRMIDVLAPLQQDLNAPKRLPVIINSAFVAALVLGAALFGGFDQLYPVSGGTQKAMALFRRFPFDPLACRFGASIEHLYEAWRAFHFRQSEMQRQMHTRLLFDTFGSLEQITSDARDKTHQTGGANNLDDGLVQDVTESVSTILNTPAETGELPVQEYQYSTSEQAYLDTSPLADRLFNYDFDFASIAPDSSLSDLDSLPALLGFDFLEGAC